MSTHQERTRGEDGGVELHELGLVPLARALAVREVSPEEVVRHFLARVGALCDLGAFVEVTQAAALERARALNPDGRGAAPLWGVPGADKDLVARAGVPTRYGSRAFIDFVPETSDPLALALDSAGSISLGKTNTPEFGLTGYTESEIAPPARNPWRPETGAGGSSGGAAVAVATGQLPAAAASDGGGSIRIPAATVGVVGIKPSRGRLPIANGLDSPGGLSVAGPIARSVEDAAHLLDALAASGPPRHATTAQGSGPFAEHARRDPDIRMRVGATLVTPWDGWTDTTLDPRALAAYELAARALATAGHDVDEAAWEPAGYPEMFTTIWKASAARVPVADDRLDAAVGPFTAWMVRQGRALSAETVIGGYQAATAFERATIEAFSAYDAVLTPALAMEPQPIGWASRGTEPMENFARQCSYAPHTSFVNVAGLPAITVPVTSEPDERPWSVQLVGRPGGESAIIALAAQLERARGTLPLPPV